MATLIKKQRFLKNGSAQTANIYSTTAEAGSDYIPTQADGVAGYVAIGSTTDSRATLGRIKKSSAAAELAVLSTGKPPYNKVEYRTPGTYTITFPPGTTTAKVTVAERWFAKRVFYRR